MFSKKQHIGSHLTPYMSPLGAWALALGTSVGWGSLVVTSNTYLTQAGPAGSTIGMLIGMVIMLIISRSYHYMINCYPDAGGAYAYSKHAFGYDSGFLTAWFLALTYLSIFWANASSLPLFAKYFLGDMFQFGFHYSIFGYEIYLGEALLSIAAIFLIALLCGYLKKFTSRALIVLAIVFVVGIAICFAAAMIKHGSSSYTFDPAYIPEQDAFSQIIRIACISPWAFIGFENISHASEEFTFPHRKVFRILTIAVVSTTLLYIFVIILSTTAYPPEYSSWLEYINDHGNISGIKGLPAFYAAYCYLGSTGVMLLILALFALIVSSLIGNTLALSRLFYALAKDSVIPKKISRLGSHQIPVRAVMLVAFLSCLIPFLGRTAIGWIVDVTTIGATLIYGIVAASAAKTAKERGDKGERLAGLAGVILMIIFGALLLMPTLFSVNTMATESYFLFTVWAILGFLFFRNTLKRDKARRFGKSIVVWIALLSLVLFTALVWMSQTNMTSTGNALHTLQDYYLGDSASPQQLSDADVFMEHELSALRQSNARILIVVVALFAVALGTMLNNYNLIRKRAEETEAELGMVRSMANKDALTGVKNKRAYSDVESHLNKRIAAGEISEIAVVVCDVNGLKHVNDTYGHKAGDEYICSASRLICELFAHSPVFRIGGDEFAVILTGQDYNNRESIMAELNNRVESNIERGNVVVASGLSERSDDDTTLHDAFERADNLMYERKKELKSMGARTR